MEYVYAILGIFAGIGTFLVGCRLLSENMERLANSKIRGLFNKTSKNKMVGVGIGAATTALVQSSGLTTVMVVGFVNAGIMTLYQAATIIMGANIGTTVTGLLAALQSLPVAEFMAALAGIGIFMVMFAKKDKYKMIGNILTGIGLVFVGLAVMKSSMDMTENEAVKTFLANLDNPFLLLLIGIMFTALVQSSSATTAVIITMAQSSLLVGGGGNAVLFLILGTNIGSCATALISCIGTSANAKRTSIIHLLFNTFGAAIFFIILLCWPSFMDDTFAKVVINGEHLDPGMQIAFFHLLFNVIATIIFLPFTNMFVKLSQKIIRDKATTAHTFLDKRFLVSPAIAIDAATKESLSMLDCAMSSLGKALEGFINSETNNHEEVLKNNTVINETSKNISNYLIQISTADMTLKGEQSISALHTTNSDIVRVSELADNILKYTNREIKETLVFSNAVKSQLREMLDRLCDLHNVTKKIILDKRFDLVPEADELEEIIDEMRKELVKGHIVRLNNGECRAESSSVFINLVSNLERVGDHISYIAHTIPSV